MRPLWQQGSAEPSTTNTFLVCWPAHNKLIAFPTSPTHILFWFAHTVTISPVYLYFLVLTCLCMFRSQCFTSFHPSALMSSTEQPWTTTQKGQPHYLDVQIATLVSIRLPAHIHVCSTLPHKIHAPPTSHLNFSKKTL